jgi:hypothetical protein
MTKIAFSKKELVLQLKYQLSAIEDLCEMYDKGKTYLAQDIAVKLRVIFHNTNQSRSLINHLKLDHLQMFCTCNKYNPANLLKIHLGLVCLKHEVGKGWDYGPHLIHVQAVKVSIENWWANKKVLVDSEENAYTRSKIIKAIANKDGGAHVDEHLDKDYYDLTRANTSGWVFVTPEGGTILLNPVPASIRQMAYEVLESFRNISIYNESKLYDKDA